MKAMIFAAGLGTRLKPLTDTMPKALVNVGGEPLLSRVIRKLQKYGFDEFVVNVHHFAGQIISYLEENDNFGSKIQVSLEKEMPLETGGAIKFAAPLLKGCGRFLVHNVDILSNLDVADFIKSAPKDALATLLVKDRKTSRYLLFDSANRLVGWTNVETGEVKRNNPNLDICACRKLAFSGVHLVNEEILTLMQDWPEKFSIIDFYLSVADKYPIYAYEQDDLKIIDVGKISTLSEAEKFI